tara:strand:+ start:1064 stop:2938 length:1875 start_codon:yes stop_codon:yes gene_type:complete
MSFLITSNTAESGGVQLSGGINRPFSYFNNLQDTFKIPKNSEIAVQSIKINKEGNFHTNARNNQFYIYQGEDLDDVTGNDINLTTSTTSYGFVTNDQGENSFSANVDDFAGFVQKAFRRATYLPNNQVSVTNTSGTQVTVKRNASGVDFEGFKFSFTGHPSASNGNNIAHEWAVGEVGQVGHPFGYNSGTGFLQNNDNADDVDLIGTNYPLSLTNGSYVVSIHGHGGASGRSEEWQIGLTRCTRTKRIDVNGSFPNVVTGDEDPSLQYPTYFNASYDPFYDYVVRNEEDTNGSFKIKIFQATSEPNNDIEMTELDYRTGLGIANYIDANASHISQVGFTLNNERVAVNVYNASTTAWITLVDGTDVNASRNLKPVNQCCWNLYPKISLPPSAEVKIERFEGIGIDGHVYGSETLNPVTNQYEQKHCDWWATCVNTDQEENLCQEVDNRFMIRTGNTTAYSQFGLNASGLVNKDIVLVLTKSEKYQPSWFANTQDIFGFTNRGIVDQSSSPIAQFNPIFFESDNVPKVVSNNSLFVRLKNMTFNSVNFSKSSLSKILYHLPRFDNSGAEVGGLFFEPSERVYLKLNNIDDLFINDIEVEIVNSDEKLATNLTGKTIVCFHIRDAK